MTPFSRRTFLQAVAATSALAACGDDGSDTGNTPSGSMPASPAPTTPTTRSVNSDTGPVEVPVQPRRVVAAIGSFEIDMVAVGVMPVLTSTFAGPWVDLDDTVTITSNIPPTPEELVALRPDLIVGWNWVTQEPIYDELSAIAPYVGLGETAATAGPGFDGGTALRSWDTLFLSVCDAVGRRVEGDALVAEFEQRLDDLAARRAAEPAITVARIEFYEAGTFSYRGLNEDTAELMRRIGLTPVGPDNSVIDASLERLAEIDADWLVVPVGTDNMPRSVYEEVAETPLFQAIPAVRAGRVHLVDAALWPGLGHLWARALTDDLERLFVPAA